MFVNLLRNVVILRPAENFHEYACLVLLLKFRLYFVLLNKIIYAAQAQHKTERLSLLCGSGYLHDLRMASHKQSSVVSSRKIFAFLNIFLKMYLLYFIHVLGTNILSEALLQL